MPETTTNGKATKATKTAKRDSWSDDGDRAGKDAAHLEAMESEPPRAGNRIVLPKLGIQAIRVRIVGDSALICNHFSEKSKRQMRDKQTQKASAGQQAKDPEADFRNSLYIHPEGGHGFPAIAFKNAAVEACTSLGKSVITKIAARQAFHMVGDLVRIEGEPQMREDMVRLQGKTADIRYRAEFFPWSTELTIRFNASVLSDEQIVNLMNTAGFAVGVGEWRPECNGSFGLFHVS